MFLGCGGGSEWEGPRATKVGAEAGMRARKEDLEGEHRVSQGRGGSCMGSGQGGCVKRLV